MDQFKLTEKSMQNNNNIGYKAGKLSIMDKNKY